MPLLTGFLLVLLAGLLQGSFILPMTLVKRWSWEHTWATFSLLGMLVFNWIITLLFVPNIFAVYAASPGRDLAILALFGLGWGVGAVLFGLGMDRLGMALGYPIIMGLIASLGALIPLLVFFPQTLLTTRGVILLAGTALVIFGIVLCSIAGSRRTPSEGKSTAARPNAFKIGLAIAILAGILSCLPNVGVAFGGNVVSAAESFGCLPGCVRQYRLGAAFHLGVCRQRHLLPVPDDHAEDAGTILEPGDAAELGIERPDGGDVDWKFLSLRSRRRQARTLGRGGGLAAVHFSFHYCGQSLGLVARRVARRPGRRPPAAESGTADPDRGGDHGRAEQLVLTTWLCYRSA